MNYYIHNVPGRLRVKIPALKQRHRAACRVAALFDQVEGVEVVQANALTGSLKITYDPEIVDHGRLLNILHINNVIDAHIQEHYDSDQYTVATRFTQALGKALINWAVSKSLQSNGLGLLATII